MSFAEHLLFASLLVTTWAGSGCWLLQVVCYPTYRIVGAAEFVPFHVDFGRRLIPVFVIPAVLGCLSFYALLFLGPASAPRADLVVAAVAGTVILGTTGLVEVPTHMALDRDGKSDARIESLIRWNASRAIAWTAALLAIAHATLTVFATS